MTRRVKIRLLILALLQWQVGLMGLMLPTSTLHAQGLHHAHAAVEIAEDAGSAHCHGEEMPAEHEPAPAEDPPCCQSHGCDSHCSVMPAMPTAIVAVGFFTRAGESMAMMRITMVPPPQVEFFRPPI
jgi:hypothetical protein